MAALDKLSVLEAKMSEVYAQAGPDLDFSKVTVLGDGTTSAKIAAFNALDRELTEGREVDKSGRALAARAGGFNRPSGERSGRGLGIGQAFVDGVTKLHGAFDTTSGGSIVPSWYQAGINGSNRESHRMIGCVVPPKIVTARA